MRKNLKFTFLFLLLVTANRRVNAQQPAVPDVDRETIQNVVLGEENILFLGSSGFENHSTINLPENDTEIQTKTGGTSVLVGFALKKYDAEKQVNFPIKKRNLLVFGLGLESLRTIAPQQDGQPVDPITNPNVDQNNFYAGGAVGFMQTTYNTTTGTQTINSAVCEINFGQAGVKIEDNNQATTGDVGGSGTTIGFNLSHMKKESVSPNANNKFGNHMANTEYLTLQYRQGINYNFRRFIGSYTNYLLSVPAVKGSAGPSLLVRFTQVGDLNTTEVAPLIKFNVAHNLLEVSAGPAFFRTHGIDAITGNGGTYECVGLNAGVKVNFGVLNGMIN